MSTKKSLAPATQEIRVQIDVSITLSTKYSAEETRAIIDRNARAVFPNNYGKINSLRYAEEAAIYSGDAIQWSDIIKTEREKELENALAKVLCVQPLPTAQAADLWQTIGELRKVAADALLQKRWPTEAELKLEHAKLEASRGGAK